MSCVIVSHIPPRQAEWSVDSRAVPFLFIAHCVFTFADFGFDFVNAFRLCFAQCPLLMIPVEEKVSR